VLEHSPCAGWGAIHGKPVLRRVMLPCMADTLRVSFGLIEMLFDVDSPMVQTHWKHNKFQVSDVRCVVVF
jgi:hypothetical protein